MVWKPSITPLHESVKLPRHCLLILTLFGEQKDELVWAKWLRYIGMKHGICLPTLDDYKCLMEMYSVSQDINAIWNYFWNKAGMHTHCIIDVQTLDPNKGKTWMPRTSVWLKIVPNIYLAVITVLRHCSNHFVYINPFNIITVPLFLMRKLRHREN